MNTLNNFNQYLDNFILAIHPWNLAVRHVRFHIMNNGLVEQIIFTHNPQVILNGNIIPSRYVYSSDLNGAYIPQFIFGRVNTLTPIQFEMELFYNQHTTYSVRNQAIAEMINRESIHSLTLPRFAIEPHTPQS